MLKVLVAGSWALGWGTALPERETNSISFIICENRTDNLRSRNVPLSLAPSRFMPDFAKTASGLGLRGLTVKRLDPPGLSGRKLPESSTLSSPKGAVVKK
jgi:hypothetical protein